MKFSLTVVHPREAGYAAAMFDALEDAMDDNPPPEAVTQTETDSVDGLSHSSTTTQLIPASSTGVRRGRKTDAERAEKAAARLAAKDAAGRTATAAGESALRPGDALKGVPAQSLAQALAGMPLVNTAEGVQMRVAPGTSPEEIAEIKARLNAEAEDEKKKLAEHAAAEKVKADRAAAAHAAAEKAAADKLAADAKPGPAGLKLVESDSGMDSDLASLFRKKDPAPPAAVAETATDPKKAERAAILAQLSEPELLKAFTDYVDTHGGMFWARRFMAHFSLESLSDMTPDQTRHALTNPEEFSAPATA